MFDVECSMFLSERKTSNIQHRTSDPDCLSSPQRRMETETPLNAVELQYESLAGTRRQPLLRELWRLALPVLVEQVLHMFVGLNDTYLANHVERGASTKNAATAAAVGT